jgi:hypothetical protein
MRREALSPRRAFALVGGSGLAALIASLGYYWKRRRARLKGRASAATHSRAFVPGRDGGKVDDFRRVEHIQAMTGPENADIERLRVHFAGCPGIRLAVLFGSRASGAPRPASDYDIGILPRAPELSLSDELRLG